MRIYARLTPTLLLAAALTLPCACASDDCEDNKNSLPLAGFYDAESPLEAVALDSVQIIGAGVPSGESAQSGYSSGNTQCYVPFRVDSDTTVYYLIYRQRKLQALGLADTITFIYRRDPYFISKACGAIYRYVIDDIKCSHTFLDSVTCPAGVIDNKPVENLKFYFRVERPNDDETPEI